jgi:lysophospholipase L1-like esterase
MRRRLLAGLLGLALGLALAEGAARWIEARSPDRPAPAAPPAFRPHALLSFELTPGVQRRGRETIGPHGFRGAAPAVPKPADVVRILCLGGSTTYGDGLADGETYPEQLQALLAQRGGARCEVVNLGVPAYTSAETFLNLCLRGLDLEPDAIVVYHAVNDYRPRTVPDLDAAYQAFRRVWTEEELERTALARALESSALARAVRGVETRRHGLFALIERDVPRRLSRQEVRAADRLWIFERNLRAIAAVARARGIAVVLATQAQRTSALQEPEDREPIDEHNRVTRAVAHHTGAVLCEVAQDFPEQDTFLPGDPVHLNAAGSLEQARRVLACLEQAGALDRASTSWSAQVAAPPQAPVALPSPLDAATRRALAEGRLVRPCAYFGYEPAPGVAATSQVGPHDAEGFRGAAPDDGSQRCIAFVGGAAAYGLGVREEQATPRRLEALLRAGGAQVRVINAGVPGHTSAETLARLHFRVLARPRVEAVVIACDVEDTLALAAPGFRSDYGHWRKPLREDEPRGLRRWFEVASAAGDDAFGVGAPLRSLRPARPPYDPGGLARAAGAWLVERNLRSLVDLTRAHGARAILLRASSGAVAASWNEAVERVARQTGAEVVDAALDSDPAGNFLAGGWLPSAQGHARRAQVLAEALR